MKKLPLYIGEEIVIQSLDKTMPHKARSKIIGARHGEFILVEEPVVAISDRLVALVEGPVNCWYIHEGTMYKFSSTIKEKIKDGITFLEYPERFEIEMLRKYPRITVNLETRSHLGKKREEYAGSIVDISSGGCRLEVETIVLVVKEDPVELSFDLPTGEPIRGIEGKVRSVKIDRVRRKTTIGIEFTGPEQLKKKIETFCHFCEYFRVE
ncbi:flagellar brake protein [Thermodesulforhabdus norvegica]|uniref:C-di-GMP-binding flagellar brake protein YcgR, contains PilZNR and PilZ domains n=1 Tax=Thermodesulforhabdus norvegica TaxID=39841 RepID=A0A1I4R1B5_9BACT|nr:flagellar brake protein [Thermodesulforhabdus norvegica]SFM46104.1 c-di-GMP-binding flagellar brake protein YcgR, contains PilZNR and PilZ domains [Thermodesulforhabdus norvegica]